MISYDKAQKFIQSNKPEKFTKHSFTSFSEEYQFLALLLTGQNAISYYYNGVSEEDIKKYIEHFGDDYTSNPWTTKEGKKLAKLIFGDIQSPFIGEIWNLINSLPYQTGWDRRSFRSLPNVQHLNNKLIALCSLHTRNEQGFKSMSLLDLARFDVYVGFNDCVSYLLSIALDDGNESLRKCIQSIFIGEDEVGGVSRTLIKAFLLTKDKMNWEFVGKLLLAAQRQEGLRQTILESLDETSMGALKYLMNLMVKENLVRFSSVVRAVDTWFGFEWEAPKKKTIVRVLQFALNCFDDPNIVEQSLASKDNLEIYVGLWFHGLTNVDTANLKAIELLKNREREKKILACMFIIQTQRTNSGVSNWIEKNYGKDIELDYWALSARTENMQISEALFLLIFKTVKDIPRNGIKKKGSVFSWADFTIKADFFTSILIEQANEYQLQKLAHDLSVIPSDMRLELLNKIYPGYASWGQPDKETRGFFQKSIWRRQLVFQMLRDRNSMVSYMSTYLLKDIDLESEDLENIEMLLARKGKELREALITLISNLEDRKVKLSVSRLIESKKVDQRLAALEVLFIMKGKKRLHGFISEQISHYKGRGKFSKNEEVYLEKFSFSEEQKYTLENGFEQLNYDNLRPVFQPHEVFKRQLEDKMIKVDSNYKTFLHSDLIDISKLKKALYDLINVLDKNKHFEYEIEEGDGGKRTVLLQNELALLSAKGDFDSIRKVENLPLAQKWKDWYKRSALNELEMLVAIFSGSHHENYLMRQDRMRYFRAQYVPEVSRDIFENEGRISQSYYQISLIIECLLADYGDKAKILEFQLNQMEDIIFHIPKEINISSINESINEYDQWPMKVEKVILGHLMIHEFKEIDDRNDLLLRYLDLKMCLVYSCHNGYEFLPQKSFRKGAIQLLKNRSWSSIPTWLITKLFSDNLLSEDDLRFHYLKDSSLMQFIDGENNYYTQGMSPSENLKLCTYPLKTNLLTVELNRGDVATDASKFIGSLRKVEGFSYLLEFIERLGKENLSRGYSWGGGSRKDSFSSLIKKCVPAKTDTKKRFINAAKTLKVSKKRWIEIAIYAPQWARWIGELIEFYNIESTVWWFHAHCSQHMDVEKETIVSRYSSIEKEDFNRGAVDVDWFKECYDEIGKANWKLFHDAAKYVSTGNEHRLVKIYSSIMLGEIKIRETLAKIKNKRDKDYVRGLGLIPLSKSIKEKDLLSRYNLLQTFLKESKQYGSIRQQSEKEAVQIGMENLARNAGYDDSIRFAWAMEGKAAQEIMTHSIKIIDNVRLKLTIDDQGKANILVQKDGNTQKSIPNKLKKDKNVLELQKNRAYLISQYSRTRKSLESAMLNEVFFSTKEIKNIMLHPVVKAMLSKLVLINKNEKISGFWMDGFIVKVDGMTIKAKPDDKFVIAHPSHLHRNAEWNLFQKLAFEQRLTQPFKQIFRELYIVTKNERELFVGSNRYEGHQVQPKQAAALLRGRGWTANNYEGLQKVYHNKKVIASMNAMADWFSPADIEAPTIEKVNFYHQKDYSPILINEVDPLIFSEVMRDIDLVVSIAHVGGVDPEASHSTLEMRAVLAKESARLFKLTNIEVLERHILIKGKLAEYSIHLGSGQVSKGGLSLSIISVHSQHRGRIFLPFIDDDPKSAEIISKMKLLAEDNKIQDPTILAQINS